MQRLLKLRDKKLMGEFETLCAFHTPIECIADRFGVSIYTLKRWVQDTYKEECSCVYKRFMQGGNAILNKSALALAQKNSQMNIWLRKQWLGERDPDKEALNKDEDIDIEDTPDVFSQIANILKGN